MKIPRHVDKRTVLDITPLIDVVFILLVFFMLAGAIRPTAPFPVSPAETSAEDKGELQDFVVLVDMDGRLAVNGDPIGRESLSSLVTLALAQAPETLIQLKPDAATEADLVIDLMEEISEAGAESLILITVGAGESGTPPEGGER